MQMRLKGGQWYAAFRHKGRWIGEKLKAGKEEKKLAIINLGKLFQRLEGGYDPTHENMRIEKRCDEYLAILDISDGEKERSNTIVAVHILKYFRGKRLYEITDDSLIEYVRWREKKSGAAKATLKRELRVLAGILKRELPQIEFANRGKTPDKALTLDQVLYVQTFITGQSAEFGATYELIYEVMAFSALDIKEVVMLSWSQVDLEGGWITTARFKSGNKVRVPICARLNKVFRSIKVRNIGGKIFDRVTPSMVKVAIYRAFKKAGLPEFSAKSLRHFTASLLFNAGVDSETIGKILGHSKGSRCTSVYTHTSDSRAKKIISILDSGEKHFENGAL